MAWKKIPAINSAADMQDVGWPDPAAVVDIIERMLSRRAFSLIASMVEGDGPAVVVALMSLAPFAGGGFPETESYIVRGVVREPHSTPEGVALRTEKFSEKFNVTHHHYQSDGDKHQNEGADDDQHRRLHFILGFQRSGFFLVVGRHSGILALLGALPGTGDTALSGSFRQFLHEIDDLAGVMVGVGGHAHEASEARVGARLARIGIRGHPIAGSLLANGRDDHGDGGVEIGQHFFLGVLGRVAEFERAVADVAGVRDMRADVVVQVAGEMQQQMADAIAVGIRFGPKLLG